MRRNQAKQVLDNRSIAWLEAIEVSPLYQEQVGFLRDITAGSWSHDLSYTGINRVSLTHTIRTACDDAKVWQLTSRRDSYFYTTQHICGPCG